jgi:hypothetical protein
MSYKIMVDVLPSMTMRLRIIRVCPLIFACAICHQLTAFAQEATGTLERDKITAGQTFNLVVHLSPAPTYKGNVQLMFEYKPVEGTKNPFTAGRFGCSGISEPNNRDVILKCEVPFDLDGGIYNATNIVLLPAAGGSRQRSIPIKVPDIEIIATPDTNVYAKSATADVLLNQQQILQDGAAKIDVLLDDLNTKVDNNAAETPQLMAFLKTIAQTGQSELETSRVAYRKTLANGSIEPIFFEDFARLYAAYLYEIQTAQNAELQNSISKAVHFQTVQFPSNQTVTVRPSQLNNSLGPYVSKLADLLISHLNAFTKISKNGSVSFTISLHSTPPGASISYKRIGENYQDYSKPTDVDQATFPYALWTFQFVLGKCKVVKTINPYIEQSPNLAPSMLHCKAQ